MQSTLRTFSGSLTPLARLFVLKSLLIEGEKYIIITDKEDDLRALHEVGSRILGQEIVFCESLADVLLVEHSLLQIFVIKNTLLEIAGTTEYLKRRSVLKISRGERISIEEMIEKILSFGYTHSDYPGELGSYKREGSILTLTDHESGNIAHIEWFGDEIENIIEIDAKTHTRSFREILHVKKRGTDEDIQSSGGILNEGTLEHIVNKDSRNPHLILFGCDFLSYLPKLKKYTDMHFTDFHHEGSIHLDIEVLKINHLDAFLSFLREKQNQAVILCWTRFEKSVQDFLEENSVSGVCIETVSRFEGTSHIWKDASGKEHIYITNDIVGEIFVRNRTRKSLAKNLDLLLSLKPGDFVVHREHGIARFDSIVSKVLGDLKREYLELHYAEGDKLFVPITELYRITKYIGNTDVELTRLSGKEWEKTMEKTDEEISLIAADILETSAKRSLVKGRAFASFREKEELFRKAFKYEHTPDQTTAIEEIFSDMEDSLPMDRLLSGDVGFGKTEVAMNAIYKAVLSGTQVAVISPLLVLADEHFETISERLEPFGVKIGIMTRMQSDRENTETLEKLRNGMIDVVIGTHRLLSDDVVYKKLGLLIIDEEHKFGVSHKEKIKKIRVGIDILALSATPIPRSLNLALSGLKKISLLTTPPKKKKPIETIVSKWDEHVIRHAIQHELSRGGQVIIVHNRIRGMESMQKEIEMILDVSSTKKKAEYKASIIITHGQMPGDDIEERIHAFKKQQYNILLTTTIIENGVNFLSANTILIIDPEDFGLASLHQLRGRVGRKDGAGYCYLLYRKGELQKDEKTRLITIANNSHLGAGFEIAMRDMEIRGAGDVLGIKQSGKSKDVGLTLYFRMLEEKIEALKNAKQNRTPTKIEFELSYVIDESYFLSEQDKLQFYREMESIENLEELEEIKEQMLQKQNPRIGEAYGESEGGKLSEGDESKKKKMSEANEFFPPSGPFASFQSGKEEMPSSQDDSLINLFLLLRARILLTDYGVKKLSKVGTYYVFELIDDTDAPLAKRFLERFDTKKVMILLSLKKIRVETRYWKGVREFLEGLVR